MSEPDDIPPPADAEETRYIVMGGDHVEYGPKTPEEVRDWIRQGRLDTQSLIKEEDDNHWHQLGALPEFGPDLGAAPGPPPVVDYPGHATAPTAPTARTGPQGSDNLLAGPAKFLTITAIASMVMTAWNVYTLTQSDQGMPPEMQEMLAKFGQTMPTTSAVMIASGFIIFLNSTVIWTAQLMKRRRHWGLCVAGCIASMLCANPGCCPIGLGAGIWGLMVLFRPEVRGSFS